MRTVPHCHCAQRGFTLVEAIMVMVITGIIGAVVAVFIRAPVQGYFDTVRRAELVDTADVALRRITRDLRGALPNSVRVSNVAGRYYLELLATTGGARYRSEVKGSGIPGDRLDFSAADSSFDVIGQPPTFGAGRWIVVANLGPGSGADAYAGDNRSAWTSLAGARVNIAAKLFPVASPASRFQVVDTPVSYECDPTSGQNVLRRYWGYVIGTAQPTPPAGGSSALLASKVSACLFSYDATVAATRSGVVSMRLELTSGGETVVLFQQAHVNNAP